MGTNVYATITALEAQAAASLFLSDHLPDRFLASSPKLDDAAHVWRVPILLAYPFIGPVGQTGEILVNESSEEIISYTPLEEMKAAARRLYEENRDAKRLLVERSDQQARSSPVKLLSLRLLRAIIRPLVARASPSDWSDGYVFFPTA